MMYSPLSTLHAPSAPAPVPAPAPAPASLYPTHIADRSTLRNLCLVLHSAGAARPRFLPPLPHTHHVSFPHRFVSVLLQSSWTTAWPDLRTILIPIFFLFSSAWQLPPLPCCPAAPCPLSAVRLTLFSRMSCQRCHCCQCHSSSCCPLPHPLLSTRPNGGFAAAIVIVMVIAIIIILHTLTLIQWLPAPCCSSSSSSSFFSLSPSSSSSLSFCLSLDLCHCSAKCVDYVVATIVPYLLCQQRLQHVELPRLPCPSLTPPSPSRVPI